MKHAREDYNRIQDPEKLIPEDEPVLLFRAQDKYATKALRAYVKAIKADPVASHDALEVAKLVDKWADVMDAWRLKKSPDLK